MWPDVAHLWWRRRPFWAFPTPVDAGIHRLVSPDDSTAAAVAGGGSAMSDETSYIVDSIAVSAVTPGRAMRYGDTPECPQPRNECAGRVIDSPGWSNCAGFGRGSSQPLSGASNSRRGVLCRRNSASLKNVTSHEPLGALRRFRALSASPGHGRSTSGGTRGLRGVELWRRGVLCRRVTPELCSSKERDISGTAGRLAAFECSISFSKTRPFDRLRYRGSSGRRTTVARSFYVAE
mmetsp:Transcript_4111/g.9100  ORF Transcript_4111/g.9100 Transcript_4111/m.9100 type:complete len:235 (-) Transcript_4111:183-887(-)